LYVTFVSSEFDVNSPIKFEPTFLTAIATTIRTQVSRHIPLPRKQLNSLLQ